MARTQLISKERSTTYATTSDFCRIFKEDMQSLYSLSLMLAAEPDKAEQLFVSGLDDAAGTPVFKEWAKAWARRTIIKNAVRLIAPELDHANGVSNVPVSGDAAIKSLPELPPEIRAVLGLGAFERFAFILSALEGYSDQDSALLLGCTRQALIAARVRAEQELARSMAAHVGHQSSAKPNNQASAIELAEPAAMPIPA